MVSGFEYLSTNEKFARKWLSEETLQVAEERREVKARGKGRYNPTEVKVQ